MLFLGHGAGHAQDNAGQRADEALTDRCAERAAIAHPGEPEPHCQMEWQRRLAAEQRRIGEIRAERQRSGARSRPGETKFQFRDILTDDTLRAGDIVVLDDRQFVFTGKPDDARSKSDFARIRTER